MPDTPEMAVARARPWSDMVAPIVIKCEVAAAFGQEVGWDAVGADALGRLLKGMAERLDAALATSVAAGGKESLRGALLAAPDEGGRDGPETK